MHSVTINSEIELGKVAKRILEQPYKEKVFLFYGQMGAGKTTLIKEICRHLEVDDEVSSPTYALVNEYKSPKHGSVFHFDLYRLKNIKEVIEIGLFEYLDSGSYCLIEWPENAGALLEDEGYNKIIINVNEKQQRVIHF